MIYEKANTSFGGFSVRHLACFQYIIWRIFNAAFGGIWTGVFLTQGRRDIHMKVTQTISLIPESLLDPPICVSPVKNPLRTSLDSPREA